MQWLSVLLLFFICGCEQKQKENIRQQPARPDKITTRSIDIDTSYTDAKKWMANKRNELILQRLHATNKEQTAVAITNYWIDGISTNLYKYWAGTPWDYNGTTRIPKQGTIACGYFVTTLLLDMGMILNRTQLSTCAASEMMHRLAPQQKMKILNGLTYPLFCDSLKHSGRGVYIIGLDFHVGFIVNDGLNCWFIHSNYIGRYGVTKELVLLSAALKASKTRWLIDLTGDEDFIDQWLAARSV